jgi:arsenite-transporting ATPase
LAGNDRGASCLGPHSGLKMQEARFNAALARAEQPVADHRGARHPARPAPHAGGRPHRRRAASAGPCQPAPGHQRRVPRQPAQDPVADAIERLGREAMDHLPDARSGATAARRSAPACLRHRGPARAARLAGWRPSPRGASDSGRRVGRRFAARRTLEPPWPTQLAAKGTGSSWSWARGAWAKPRLPLRWPWGWCSAGHSVHLTTTDPAAHVQRTLNGSLPGLKVGRIDPKAETQAYIDKIMATRGKALDDAGRPCCWKTCSRPAPKRWPCSTPSAAW